MDARPTLERIFQHVREIGMLESTLALLEWDERTGLPETAGEYRAEQITQLSGMIHQRKVDVEYADRLNQVFSQIADSGLSFAEASSIRLLHRDYERNRKLPTSLVQATSKATVLGQQAWQRARQADSWPEFEPHLAEIVKLKREEASLLAGDADVYDALLDQYEMGARTGGGTTETAGTNLTVVFERLREGLRELLARLGESKRKPTGAAWQRPVDVDRQQAICRAAAESIGFSFDRGRLDVTTHPFCTTLGPNDCRILTRYHRDFFPTSFYGTLHEAGHGLYEQGLPTEWYALPAGKYAGLGVHESQSRLWENLVGRSRSFWEWAFPKFEKLTGTAWQNLDANQVYRDANLVQPSLIRVEADEATYNLHILIRFELEQRLISQELSIADAPAAWNERYQHYLGITPINNREGILQDVHWSAGLIGYFPTYTLGNLYSAQLMQAAQRDLGDTDAMFRRGEFDPLLQWLRHQVHAHGACYAPTDLVRNACGRPLDHQPLLDYLQRKLSEVYEI